MTPEQQRIAIAEACGWTKPMHMEHRYRIVGHPDTFLSMTPPPGMEFQMFPAEPPRYLTDLNAMHEAEKVLTDDWQQENYLCKIQTVIDGGRTCFKVSESDHWQVARATASQRAEAFARVCFPERFNR